ncbi:hypothetical protein L195_g057050 [Trifolium pratense]|uniref:Uncharacterized protein n=1 Tax=Trifolium pratense TaxID=57577 RepID=A0A2K3KUR9_TRIPR|nr:hypothetical protein L195_g057050 [Trifolium pratense]
MPRVIRLDFVGNLSRSRRHAKMGYLQRNLRMPNKMFCIIQSNRIKSSQELVSSSNSVTCVRIWLPPPPI